jgi:rare lipoprotein A
MVRFKTTGGYCGGFLVCATALLISGCSSKFVGQEQLPASGAKSRYSIAQDKAPAVALADHQIAETPARPEVRSLYGNKSPYTVNNKSYNILASADGYGKEGLASWYGVKFHGHATSNGETFDMYKISAAHKTLPLPSWVRVTNLDNGKSIEVRINDRGPFHGGRIIDLSYAGAVKLGYQDKGTARVRVEAISGSALDSASYYVQIGAFSKKTGANTLKSKLADEVADPVDVYQDTYYRVRIGPVKYDRAQALQLQFSEGDLGRPLIVAK